MFSQILTFTRKYIPHEILHRPDLSHFTRFVPKADLSQHVFVVKIWQIGGCTVFFQNFEKVHARNFRKKFFVVRKKHSFPILVLNQRIYRKDLFSKWHISELGNFEVTHFPKWSLFELTNFWGNYFLKWSISKWPTFQSDLNQIDPFRSDRYCSDDPIFEVTHFPKWACFSTDHNLTFLI